ncbi:MAG TPA: translocation/assembly module TamB domain-containing protein [Bryobacteraceae bacterium]
MSRPKKILAIVAASLAGLVILVIVAAIIVIQTPWFRDFVREKIVSAIESGMGAKAEIGSFSLDLRHLRVQVRDIVIHGLEPPTAAPLVRARLVEVDLKIGARPGPIGVGYLLLDAPQANVIVFPEGRTNIPSPKTQSKPSNTSGLQTVVDLAIGKFDLRNGAVTFAQRKSDFNASGENLHAQLAYNALHPGYVGEIDMSPLHLRAAGNAPLDVNVKLPLTLEGDRIALNRGSLSTPGSLIQISAALEHMAAPRTSAQLNARLSLDEVKRAAGLNMPLDTVRGPSVLTADISASTDNNRVAVQRLNLRLGQTEITASGPLQQGNRPGSLRFNALLAVGEIGRLLQVAARPEGTVRIGGNAGLGAGGNYRLTANIVGRNLAGGQGSTRVTGATLDSSIAADPRRIELGGLRISAVGGDLTGSGALDNMQTFQFAGKLNHFDIGRISRMVKPGGFGYAGVLSGGLKAAGDVKNTAALMASADLRIQPASGGIPVSGRINANYDGNGGTIAIASSYIALPNTRLDLAGSIGQQIQVKLVTRNTADFRPVAPSIPLTFTNGGAATIDATITGRTDAPRIGAQVTLTNFSVQGRPFERFETGLSASPSGANVMNAVLTHGKMQARVSASVGLRNWKPENTEPLRADATIRDADLADILALAGQGDVTAQGALVADAHINGSVGDPRGAASLSVTNGSLQGEHFDSISTQMVMNQASIEIPTLQLVAGSSRLDANAAFQHPPNDLKRGTLRAHIASNQVQLAQFQSLVKDRPGLAGTVSLNADAVAALQPSGANTNFQLINLTANASARGLRMQNQNLGDATITANTSGSSLQYNVNSNFAGSTIRVTGQSLLTGDHQTNASAQIANLRIDRVLAVAGRSELPVSGTFGVTAQVSGTLAAPRANATLSVSNGSAYQQPFNLVQATINYTNQLVELAQLRLEDGGNHIELSGAFAHPANDFQRGQVRFRVRSTPLELARFHAVQQSNPGLTGTVELSADGAGTLRPNAVPLFSTLNANVAVKGIAVDRKPVGDVTIIAETKGQQLSFNLASDFARSNIRGNGTVELAGDYPVNARLSFSNVTYAGLSPLMGTANPTFDASVDGQVAVSGPAARTEALRGSVQLTKLEAHSVAMSAPGEQARAPFEVHNDGPIDVQVERSVVTVRRARITGPFLNLALSGSAPIQGPQPMNLRADANVNLELIESFNPSIVSTGTVTLNAAVGGTRAKPSVRGQLQLKDASFNLLEVPNGVSNANGTVAFNGSEAVIQNITAQSGGGKLTLSGNVGYGGPQMNFRVQARADQVHVRYPQTLTTTISANISLVGTTASSLASGTVRISEVAMHSHSDLGSMLSSASAPPTQGGATSGLMAGMKFDIRVMTTSGVRFRTELTQNLQADANLTLRGTPDHPGMLGRVVINQGTLVFFGNKYNVDQGTISFFDPSQIQPILNIDLNTTVQGVDVTLSVSGPVDKMKLSYRSDPPLEFRDIVSLLASGTPPSTDPVLAARQAPPPQQSVGQAGASMLMGQAVASPVAGRLQRLFGVSKLKIDPQVTGQQNTPGATLTLQQQINNKLTFTYVQDVTQSNPQTIRIEWAIDPQWSAIAGRDINGELNVDLFYKKRFH